ncbi:hypothetical protein NEMBOFW57_010573 [Staphylotrichum longicolle]|uniref:Uncharacterized protein n=1 Tax=Staphylotrichum longicolle TaxID=669026 RepID=A0AAD4END0_9PEZI|nr:hypothetical protein NEMBOFW57_010573 [Staphylotrichum longicolle]
MAAPPSANILNISGTWILQGISWPIRKILSWAGVALHLTQTSAPSSPGKPPVTTITAKQTITPGGFNSEEAYVLDDSVKHASLPIFGAVSVRARYTPLDEIDDAELRERLAKDGATVAVQEFAESKGGEWKTEGVWGFEVIGGERRFTRTNITTGRGERVLARLVYDYKA